MPLESVKLLKKLTGEDDADSAIKLSEILGYLPIALAQAGSYIVENKCSISEYIDLFESYKVELLKHGKPSKYYLDSVATTWEISFKNILKTNPEATDFMNLFSYFAPDFIPKKLLSKGSSNYQKHLKK